MSAALITIEVNGQTLQVKPGSMLIEATDAAAIQVPRFCYHKKLSVAANCRMCLVEVERSAKPLPACATPVTAGMKVWTRSEKAKAAQQDIMEFLLINHPLDCPICDQGGECELQDVSMGYGNSHSHFAEVKRVVRDKDIGPLIETALTRCIHCTRCVRFGEEIAGLRELGATGRSEHMEIGTFVAKAVTSELSGNVIDLCPVGALTAKPSRYSARAWEMRTHATIAPHDSVGSNLSVHTFDGKVIRAVPRANEDINECWISDRDRFSYQGLTSADRLTQPQIKREGIWQVVSWPEALAAVATILREADPAKTGGLAAPTATLEEFYLFQKLLRGLGVSNIDHRLRQLDYSDQLATAAVPGLGMTLPEVEQLQAVLVIGGNPRQEQPLLNHRLRKATLAGARVLAVNPRRVDFNYPVEQIAVAPLEMVAELAAIARAACELAGTELPDEIAGVCAEVDVSAGARAMAQQLRSAERSAVWLGNMSLQHPALASLRALTTVIAAQTASTCGYLLEANTVGGHLAGVLPHRAAAGAALEKQGLAAGEMLSGSLNTFLLLHAEVDDFADPQLARAAFRAAADVIVLAPFANAQTCDYATVLLPTATFAETAGTFVNLTGLWQTFKGVTAAPGEARPGWKILRVLGNSLNLPEFDYLSTEEITGELKLEWQGVEPDNRYTQRARIEWPVRDPDAMQRIGDVQMYASDALVRRATALQAASPAVVARLHPLEMDKRVLSAGDLLKLEQGEGTVLLPVEADDSVPPGCVWVQAGTTAANALGAAFGSITVSKV